MKTKTIGIRVQISHDYIENILYRAYEGTGYWAKDKEDKDGYQVGVALLMYESHVKDFMGGELEIYIYDILNDRKTLYTLNIAKIKRGLTVMAKKCPHQFAAILEENTDIYTADALIQCALFGQIKYA